MYLSGFADEAAPGLEGQIRATRALGWTRIEARNVDGVNLHDLPEGDFEAVAARLEQAGVSVNCFGSAIANWACPITAPFETSLAQARCAIPRMQRLGTKLIRIMSYAVLPGRAPGDQMEEERFRRLRILQGMFADAGLTPLHENCMNYGGMSWQHTLRLLENVPGLKLVFDTGNPVFSADCSRPAPRPRQSSWEFYTRVREHIAYVHIKDGVWDAQKQAMAYTFPGEGQGDVERIVRDLLAAGYEGGFSIEPHLSVVQHDPALTDPQEIRFDNYLRYGMKMEAILERCRPGERA